ncbi:MAG: hypothetical protein NTW50_04535 [Candidatus Berkelbacteria bacterium]|nr:hypothetical protein [Candidatus Berkelbacteria bacterium]
MGKKKCKKFKNQSKPVQQPTQINPVAQTGTTTAASEMKPTENFTPKELDRMTELNQKYAYVRKDVRKLLFVLGTVVMLFVATYFLKAKTPLLTDLGNWVYKISNFQL